MFGTISDFQFFLWLLQRESVRCAVAIHAYVLMTTHFHLMATPSDRSGLSAMVQGIGRSYVPVFNFTHQRTGGLWEGRYRSFAIEDESYWLTCMRYVELNPVRAGIVSTPEAYKWSSAQAHICGQEDPVLSSHELYLRLGATADDQQQAWQAICREALSDSELANLRDATKRGSGVRPLESSCVKGSDPN
jgi:putative transposase